MFGNVVDEKALGKSIADNLWARVAPELGLLKEKRLTVIGTIAGISVSLLLGLEDKEEG